MTGRTLAITFGSLGGVLYVSYVCWVCCFVGAKEKNKSKKKHKKLLYLWPACFPCFLLFGILVAVGYVIYFLSVACCKRQKKWAEHRKVRAEKRRKQAEERRKQQAEQRKNASRATAKVKPVVRPAVKPAPTPARTPTVSSTTSSSATRLPLFEQVELLKRELGLSGSLVEVTNQAAEQLGIDRTAQPQPALGALAVMCVRELERTQGGAPEQGAEINVDETEIGESWLADNPPFPAAVV